MNSKKHSKKLKPASSFLGGLMLVIAMVAPNIADAKNYYVAKTGNNSNPGTESQPFKTIKKGIPLLSPGDTLYIKAGTYAESIDSDFVSIKSGTSWQNAVTIAGFPGDTVTLKPNGNSGWNVLAFQSPGLKYIIIDNLVIDATNNVNGAGIGAGAHHIRIQNCEIKNADQMGVIIGGIIAGSNNNELIGLDVHHNGLYQDISHGIYISSNNNLIDKSDIHHNGHFGVHFYNEGQAVKNNIVRNSRVHENGQYKYGAEILLGSGDGNMAYNNIVYKGTNIGINVGYGGSFNDTKVFNNTVYDMDGVGIWVMSDSRNAVIQNNIAYQTAQNIKDQGNNSTVSNNLTTNPSFESASSQDFHLKPNSGAIDAGIIVNEFNFDIAGTSRPHGASYDIGAYEFSDTPPDNTPPLPPQNLAFF